MRHLGYREVGLDELTPFPGNARRGDTEAIRLSLMRVGQYRALVCRDLAAGPVILAGNHTYAALVLLANAPPSLAQLLSAGAPVPAGSAEAEDREATARALLDQLTRRVARVDLIACTDAEATRINLADNRLAELGSYDPADLAALLKLVGGDYAGTGWAAEDLTALLRTQEPGAKGDPDEVPPVPAVPVSRRGDLWHLGQHRVLCGDGTDPADVLRVTEGLEVGVVYADPPYGIDIVRASGGGAGRVGSGGKFRGKIGSGNVVPTKMYLAVAGDETTATAAAMSALARRLFPQAAQVWWGGNHYAGSAGLGDASCWLVWDKENDGNQFADAEMAWTNHPGAVRMLRHQWNGMLRASERGSKARVHPTQKPVALAEWAFGVVDPAGPGAVFDPGAGSGSALVAAHRAGRVGAVIESEPGYVDVICERFTAYTGVEAVLEDRGASVEA